MVHRVCGLVVHPVLFEHHLAQASPDLRGHPLKLFNYISETLGSGVVSTYVPALVEVCQRPRPHLNGEDQSQENGVPKYLKSIL